jgi:hypothetical protein
MADARQRATIAGQPVSISGDIVKVHGHVKTSISGQTVVAIISGLSINISGLSVNVSGAIVQISGQQVEISGQPVTVSGDIVFITTLSGQTINVNISGVTIDIVSGAIVDVHISGDAVTVSGNVVQIVNASGTCLCATTISGSVTTMDDAFMELRLMADSLKDLPMAMNPSTGQLRVDASPGVAITSGTLTTVTTVTSVTNIPNIGGNPANSFILDEMDIVWNTGIRPQIV